MAINQVTLLGNVGRDPEIRTTTSGEKVATFSVATTEKWTDKNGQKREATEWHNVVVWGGLVGAVIEPYLKKGGKVLVQGKMKTRKWQDQSGQDRYVTEVVLSGFDAKFELMGNSSGGGNRAPAPDDSGAYAAARSGTSQGASPAGDSGAGFIDDEIPF